jgi:hypothetical protein
MLMQYKTGLHLEYDNIYCPFALITNQFSDSLNSAVAQPSCLIAVTAAIGEYTARIGQLSSAEKRECGMVNTGHMS